MTRSSARREQKAMAGKSTLPYQLPTQNITAPNKGEVMLSDTDLPPVHVSSFISTITLRFVYGRVGDNDLPIP